MIRTFLTGTIVLTLAWNSASAVQQQQEQPQQDRPREGQIGQAGQQHAGQMQTIRGRITAIKPSASARPGQTSEAGQQPQAGQAGREGQADNGLKATITVESRGMREHRGNRSGDLGSEADPTGLGQDRPEAGQGQDRPEAGQVGLGQAGLGGMMTTYQFTVTDETLIQANAAADQPGQSGASTRPGSGQEPNQPSQEPNRPGQAGQQERPGQPGQQGLATPTGQPARQEYRGLRVGQFVEVTYRPTAAGSPAEAGQAEQPGQENQGDRPEAGQRRPQDQPRQDQPVGQDPADLRGDQPGQTSQGRMIRGEAVSIRVLPNPRPDADGLDRPGLEPNRPGAGNTDPARPGQENPVRRPGSDRPDPNPTP